MQFGVSDIARMFKVERDVVKTWAYHFSEYLTPEANPPKGNRRIFSIDDLRVLAYVFTYWENEPDFENIRYGLNSDSHFEEPYNSLIRENTPIFQEPPEGLDETWRHGAIFGGIVQGGDTFHLAESYKTAGDALVAAALASEEVYDHFAPVVYAYRHATELYLKAFLDKPGKRHDLSTLFIRFKDHIKAEYDAVPPRWFENLVADFHTFDPESTMFRYGDGSIGDEVWIDLPHMKILMGWMAESFQNIRMRRGSI